MRILVISGIQGSGKSTQAKKLQQAFGFIHISVGDLVRKHIEEETKFGKSYKAAYERGELAPDEVIYGIIDDALCDYVDENIILDGFPRNKKQLEWFEEKYSAKAFIVLTVPKDIAIRRILARGRSDDNKKAIEKRFAVYEESAAPIIDYYRESGKLMMIDGNRNIEKIKKDIAKKMGMLA